MTNNLKLQIITALDNAGIHATKQQINSLTNQVQTANSNISSSGNHTEKMLNRLAGNVGNFGGEFGKLGGQIAVAYGLFKSFMMSFETASSFFQKFTKEGVLTFSSIKEGFKDAGNSIKEFFTGWEEAQKKRDTRIKEMNNSITAGMESAIDFQNAQLDKTLSKQEKITKEINNSTRAYLTQANAIKNLNTAKGDEEIIGLQQNILDNVELLRSQGMNDEANQLEIYGQWLIEQRKAAIEIDGLENELVKQLKTSHSQEDLVKVKKNEIKITKEAVDNAWSQLHDLKMLYDKQGTENKPENQKRMRLQEKNIEKLENQYQQKQMELKQLEAQAETEKTKSAEIAYRLTNAQKRGVYQMDTIGVRFDQNRREFGNLIDIDRGYIDKAYAQLESTDLLKEIVEELKASRELNEQLLSFKQ